MTILGPVPAIAATVRGHASWQLLVKSEDGLQARYVIDTVIRRLEGQREFRDQKFDVDVDPIEM
jgi:primosomal protein N'